MEYVISIFLLGLIVTFIVAKGVMMSHELAAAELARQAREEVERRAPLEITSR
jgi:hypothetical protein